MKVILESTPQMVQVVASAARNITFKARLWVGHTERGVPIFALIPRIACARDVPIAEFEDDLEEPSSQHAANAFPLRFML